MPPNNVSKPAPKPPHIIIACGCTGGHLFPGIAVAQELQKRGHHPHLLISEKAIDAQASEKYTELDFITLPAIAKPPTFSPRMAPFLWKLSRTISRCKKILREKKIDLVLGMGGFTSFSPVYAAHKLGLPTYIHESNAFPGRSNLLTARYADKVLLGFLEAAVRFPKNKTAITGTPVREELATLPNQAEARETLGLDPERPTLLVMGGSQGARKLNSIILEGTKDSPWQILHLTGPNDFERVKKTTANRKHHHTLAFCDEMAAAYAASDFAIIRSGASSLTELTRVGLPALLVPYPFAADDHQTANARVYERAGAAFLIQERDLNASNLSQILTDVLDPGTRKKMAAATRGLATPDAVGKIADAITK